MVIEVVNHKARPDVPSPDKLQGNCLCMHEQDLNSLCCHEHHVICVLHDLYAHLVVGGD